jgi:hypothetical protein
MAPFLQQIQGIKQKKFFKVMGAVIEQIRLKDLMAKCNVRILFGSLSQHIN